MLAWCQYVGQRFKLIYNGSHAGELRGAVKPRDLARLTCSGLGVRRTPGVSIATRVPESAAPCCGSMPIPGRELPVAIMLCIARGGAGRLGRRRAVGYVWIRRLGLSNCREDCECVRTG